MRPSRRPDGRERPRRPPGVRPGEPEGVRGVKAGVALRHASHEEEELWLRRSSSKGARQAASRNGSKAGRSTQNRGGTQAASRNGSKAGRSSKGRSGTQAAARRSNGRTSNAGVVSSVKSRGQKAGSAIAQGVGKAKTPLIAGGAAVAGLAGGALLMRGQAGRKLTRLAMPALGARTPTAKALGMAAKEVGKAGYQVGQLTSEMRRVREAMKHS